MIRDIKTYIYKHNTVSLSDLKLHFKMETNAIMPILTKLEDKQQIQINKNNCKNCCPSCTNTDLYISSV